jgi:hypothetical protein
MVKSLSLWRLRLQYWGVLLKENMSLKVNTVIGNIEDHLHSHRFFNVWTDSNHTKTNHVNKEV